MPTDSYGLRGLSDLMAGVFSLENGDSFSHEQKARELVSYHIRGVITILCRIWRSTSELLGRSNLIEISSPGLRIRYRIRKLADTIFKMFPNDLVEEFIRFWLSSNPELIEMAV
jgi:hypothetical protein